MKKMIIIWIIIAITLSGSLLFIGFNVKKHNQEYLTLENDLVEAADIYIKTKDITLKTNEEKKILMDTLVEETMLNSELRDKLKCDGFVTIKKSLSKYEFKPYIKCDGYETIE